ncbi:MAG: MotA/TolQ/ExbB proton channel family protein [Bacteroidetes bacterium]|jgi:biopolymer transport protein ExbB|nr:MAG: MotA/TolQ/ExbB proton channel family protein [Bacteroidota bacterium]
MFHLLQIVDTVNKTLNATANAVAGESLSLMDLIRMGGWVMVPLGILLLLTVYFFAERLIAIRNASRIDNNFMNIIRDHIVSGNVTAARSFAKNTNNPVARIIDKGIQRIGKPIDNIHESMDNVGQLEMYRLERNMVFLSVISKAAPIFGFIGTLVGLMQVLSQIHNANEVAIGSVAQGIYTKLITSISGLLIGLIAYFGHSYLNSQIDKTANKMEAAASDFLDVLQEPTR